MKNLYSFKDENGNPVGETTIQAEALAFQTAHPTYSMSVSQTQSSNTVNTLPRLTQ